MKSAKAALSASLRAEQRKVERRPAKKKKGAMRVVLPPPEKKSKPLQLELRLTAEEAALLEQIRNECRGLGLEIKKRTVLRLGLRILARYPADELKELLAASRAD